MPRFAAVVVVVIFFVVQICCAPPIRAAAFEAEEEMHCPIQKQECQTAETKDCSGGPQLVSEGPVKRFISPVQLQAVPVVAPVPVAHAEEGIMAGRRSTPTRIIQLRI